jgi:hypothetical protein
MLSTHALTRTKEGFVIGAKLHGCTERAFYKVFVFLILHIIAMMFSLGLKEPGQCISSDFRFDQRGLRILILLSTNKEMLLAVILYFLMISIRYAKQISWLMHSLDLNYGICTYFYRGI